MRRTARDKMEPCPICEVGRLTRRSGESVDMFDCGTSRVDGELRIARNCQQYADGAAERERLLAELAALEGS